MISANDLSSPASLDQNVIPCDGCVLCCKSDQVILHPEAGDNLLSYVWDLVASPLYPGQVVPALKRDPATGHCVYLAGNGCSIHDRRPAVCRRFHCARTALALERLPRATVKALARRGDVFDEALLARGRDRLQHARERGLEPVLDTDQQVAAFERIAAMPVRAPQRRPRRR
ncbi:YkgJ family cysteine cluster protein [Nitrospirillum sp. BR 11163]|uniref:YkgJ family cysteine cluster protein n=1 Tax=Nitrospirillum sp. BR 11163 TaxID=3104323 RepID=UPI002AFF4658|nr:YkgJ family cysteine cluster protein [Nitrospirillum sp. BR 11163]MEA1672748.1 YkgJ family cysteine cluster protein [Nitrospirillum sp. BR 11163]